MATRIRHSQAGACTISLSSARVFRILLLQEFNRNKLLILTESSKHNGSTITSTLKQLSLEHDIPLSTLKRNALRLRHLGLVDFGTTSERRDLAITRTGTELLQLID